MHYLTDLANLPDHAARGFDIQNHAVFVVRQGEQIYIYANSCPHLGITLECRPHQFLDRDGKYIQCANHDALFTIESGYCVAGPCQGQALQPLPYQLEAGGIYLTALPD